MGNRKGAMELGVNTIVIIIIALVIIGLGIVFVTRVINPDVIPPAPELPFHASADDTVKLQPENLDVKAGKSSEVEVSVYNKDFSSDNEVALELLGCKSSEGDVEGISMTSLAQKIPLGSDAGYLGIISAAKEVPAAQYICSVSAVYDDSSEEIPGYQKQIYISVII
jgi:hypothetical protein